MSSPAKDPGPIEYARKADRRAAARAAAAATASKNAPAKNAPANGPAQQRPKRSKRADAWFGVLAIVGLIGLFAAYGLLGQAVRDALLGFVCEATRCSAAGMTTYGWLIVAAPAAAMLAIGVLWQRTGRTGRRVLIGFAVLAWLHAMLVVPGRGRDLSDLLTGPGSSQVGGGILWALGGAGAALAFLLLLVLAGRVVKPIDRHYNTVAVVGIAALVAAALPLAIRDAEPTYTRAAEVFPAVLKMNGDTLTRTELGDERGCDGVLPDDALLNRHGCIVTVRASYTTDDSDAVAVFRAVLYRDDETADAARAGLRAELAPAGAPAGAATVFSTSGPWVLLGGAGHADGRAITSAERSWVLWPLRQVSYHFIGTQVGLLIDPDPTDAIRPRTP